MMRFGMIFGLLAPEYGSHDMRFVSSMEISGVLLKAWSLLMNILYEHEFRKTVTLLLCAL